MKKKFIRKKSYLIPSLIGLGGLVALSAASIYTLIPKIQNNLAEQVKVTLGQANITADIIVSGRDITLSGATINAEMSQLAIQKVMSTRGVRKVTNNLGKEGTGDSLPNMTASTHVKSTPTPAVEVETPEDERLTDSIDDSDLGKVPELDTISDFSDDSNDILPEDVNDTNTLADNTTEDQQAIEDPKETMVTKPESSEEKELTVKDNVLDYETLLAAVNKRANKPKPKVSEKPAKKEMRLASVKNDPVIIPDLDMSQIRFQKNKKKLRSSSQPLLNKLAKKLQNSSGKIKIIVTERDSSVAFKQAKAIRAYLTSQGIKKSRMAIIGRENTINKVEITAK